MNIKKCEHCETIFKTKSALNNHKNKAKYCLTIQGKLENDECNERTELIKKDKVIIEVDTNFEKQEDNYKEQIKYLQDKLEKIENERSLQQIKSCEQIQELLPIIGQNPIYYQPYKENKADYNEKLDNITRKIEYIEKGLDAIADFLLNTFT